MFSFTEALFPLDLCSDQFRGQKIYNFHFRIVRLWFFSFGTSACTFNNFKEVRDKCSSLLDYTVYLAEWSIHYLIHQVQVIVPSSKQPQRVGCSKHSWEHSPPNLWLDNPESSWRVKILKSTSSRAMATTLPPTRRVGGHCGTLAPSNVRGKGWPILILKNKTHSQLLNCEWVRRWP